MLDTRGFSATGLTVLHGNLHSGYVLEQHKKCGRFGPRFGVRCSVGAFHFSLLGSFLYGLPGRYGTVLLCSVLFRAVLFPGIFIGARKF